ncbi:leucyl/phenylalanyl-tRNA--protein transferase [Pseudooceanicola spongiae]|uniref:Leucyl/phenylalanyl-tRNA--protein transferase n=1 Tax=Pseudooceanicola spongiae TaxID=2613965 RepID=A0A7L9WL83_9RHOB|nr:leucyl/phenylalanyl-tRNA--protein transferase [Pseudooceanicola spongiae]QOL81009.1 leucyl/phenylalanyl-tRNA--protein transferase [Pseudooceanicola spongiae]
MKDHDDDTAITPELLLQAYMSGIFPMSEGRDDPELFWVDPRRRGVFPLDGFHISRSLARSLRRPDHRVSVNEDFAGVLEGCADRPETWINDEIAGLYLDLHRRGYASSVEVWDMEGALIGGVYGVTLGRAFFGESMFSRRTDASKIALAWLVDRLNLTGFSLFDTQFLTTHLASLGGVEISRAEYHRMLAEALQGGADFDPPALQQSADDLLARHARLQIAK